MIAAGSLGYAIAAKKNSRKVAKTGRQVTDKPTPISRLPANQEATHTFDPDGSGPLPVIPVVKDEDGNINNAETGERIGQLGEKAFEKRYPDYSFDPLPNDNDSDEMCPAMCYQNPNDINDDHCYNCKNVPVLEEGASTVTPVAETPVAQEDLLVDVQPSLATHLFDRDGPGGPLPPVRVIIKEDGHMWDRNGDLGRPSTDDPKFAKRFYKKGITVSFHKLPSSADIEQGALVDYEPSSLANYLFDRDNKGPLPAVKVLIEKGYMWDGRGYRGITGSIEFVKQYPMPHTFTMTREIPGGYVNY